MIETVYEDYEAFKKRLEDIRTLRPGLLADEAGIKLPIMVQWFAKGVVQGQIATGVGVLSVIFRKKTSTDAFFVEQPDEEFFEECVQKLYTTGHSVHRGWITTVGDLSVIKG